MACSSISNKLLLFQLNRGLVIRRHFITGSSFHLKIKLLCYLSLTICRPAQIKCIILLFLFFFCTRSASSRTNKLYSYRQLQRVSKILLCPAWNLSITMMVLLNTEGATINQWRNTLPLVFVGCHFTSKRLRLSSCYPCS